MDRRTLLSGSGVLLAAQALSLKAEARAVTRPVLAEDQHFMQLAIEQAKLGDFPFGAVIVRDGKVVAEGFNSGKRLHDPTAHGEMMAIRHFLESHSPEEFQDATLYTSGEPCVMCMGAIIWCRFKRMVFAASISELATRIGQIDITSKQIANATPFLAIEITGGVLSAEAMQLFPEKQ
ncbi:Nucleoside deaminase [Hyphomicrobium sp. 1Nfss2.1]|uniref:nucleoside deaminase n=1 Tax=Hyphomicrobium sp. 1Nfss2.1 TaxID=3413936 RepID=UPI003C7DF72E